MFWKFGSFFVFFRVKFIGKVLVYVWIFFGFFIKVNIFGYYEVMGIEKENGLEFVFGCFGINLIVVGICIFGL